MSNFIFHAAAVPMRYADRVQQESTLFPLMGWPRKPRNADKFTMDLRQKQIVGKTNSLQKLWRERVESLGDAGWAAAPATLKGFKDRGFMSRCRPTFFIPKGATGFRANGAPGKESFRGCKRPAACPFCYARWVREMWLRFDFAMFRDPQGVGRAETLSVRRRRAAEADCPEHTRRLDLTDGPAVPDILPQNFGVDLHCSTAPYLIAPGEVGKSQVFDGLDAMVHVHWPNSCKQRPDEKFGLMTGGLQSLTVEPYTKDKQRKFVLTVRRLRLMPHGVISVNKSKPVAKGHKSEIKTIPQPTRKQVVSAVARVLRYPTGLLRGDVPLTIRALHMPYYTNHSGKLSRLRLNSSYGSIRTAKKQLEELGIK